VRARNLDISGHHKGGGFVPVQERVHKSVKVWTLYLDLEESLGTVETARAAYHKVLDLKIATPQVLILVLLAFTLY
jgi:hypothetical protein